MAGKYLKQKSLPKECRCLETLFLFIRTCHSPQFCLKIHLKGVVMKNKSKTGEKGN